MKVTKVLLILSLILCSVGVVFSESLTPAQMYLEPNSIPPAAYDYPYCDPNYVAEFQNVEQLQVLPLLQEDGETYLFAPPTDYEGDITGTDGSITFYQNGPYFVKATYVGGAEEYFSFGVGFLLQSGTETYKWKVIDTPSPDVVVVDPNPYEVDNADPPPAKVTKNLVDSQPDFPAGTTEVANKMTWEQVKAYLKTLTNAHVELSAHGSEGEISWGGERVLHKGNLKEELKDLVGHVNNLTFMSCRTGADPNFIQAVADILGESGGYNDTVAGNGTNWAINNNGEKVIRKRRIAESNTELPVEVGCLGPGGHGVVITGYGWSPGTDIEIRVNDILVTETITDDNGNFICLLDQQVEGEQLYVIEAKEKYEPPETAEMFQFIPTDEIISLEGITGDADNDGDVDLEDFGLLAENWLIGVL